MKFSWPVLLTLVGAAQLIIVAFHSALSRAKFPKKGLRRSERILIASSVIAAVASLAVIDFRSRTAVAQASAVATSQGSCASIGVGMLESEVTKRLGPPTERIVDEETRGPSAAVLLYKGSRCAVKTLDGRVELVE
jgi:hypothetical protein